MKSRIFAVGLVILLFGIIGTSVLGLAQTDNSTKVYWTLGGGSGSCSVYTFDIHGDVDLGSPTSFSPGDVLKSVDNTGWGSNTQLIDISTNCSNWNISVSREDAGNTGGSYDQLTGDTLDDFYQWVEDSKEPGYATLNITNMASEPSVTKDNDSPYTGEFANGSSGDFKFSMGYKYILESHDAPGTYAVDVTYTLSTS